jgi:hypothetical protein
VSPESDTPDVRSYRLGLIVDVWTADARHPFPNSSLCQTTRFIPQFEIPQAAFRSGSVVASDQGDDPARCGRHSAHCFLSP